MDTYRTQRRGGRGISGMSRREEDVATEMFVINSHDYVMFFTSTGRVYRLKCYEIPEGSRTSKGMNIANLLPITAEEKVTSMIRVPEFDEEKYLVMVTRNGIIKRTLLSAYEYPPERAASSPSSWTRATSWPGCGSPTAATS